MLSLLGPSASTRRVFHRVAALVALGLQVAVAASPVWEPRPGVRLGAHVEEQGGALHADQHNEESCVVCAARLQASAPTAPLPAIAFTTVGLAPMARAEYAATDVQLVSVHSRAPPSLTS